MLIRFAVENYRSFKNRQIFTMAAGPEKQFSSHLYTILGHSLLKSSFFFGPNASGKSNLIRAIDFMRQLVRTGDAGSGQMKDTFFRIDPVYADKPGIFQAEFVEKNNLYSYGFALNYKKQEFESEWLYKINSQNGNETCIFERDIVEEKFNSDLNFSENELDAMRLKVYTSDIAPDKLLLTEIAQKAIDKESSFQDFKRAYRWFLRLIVIYPESHAVGKNRYFLTKDDRQQVLKDMLHDFDTGIESLMANEKKLEDAIAFAPEQTKERIKRDIDQNQEIKRALHQGKGIGVTIGGRDFTLSLKDGTVFAQELTMNHGNSEDPFQLVDESEGTQRLFDLIPAYQMLKQGRIVLVDEIDRSFHSRLTEEFVKKYFTLTKRSMCQLVCTSHDLSLMSPQLLRADEIWLVERQEDHSSKLYSLADFKDEDAGERLNDYLLGRFGALPHFLHD